MTDISPIVSPNQNYQWSADRADPTDKTKWTERSNALCGEEWGLRNAKVGGETANGMELNFLIGIVRNYFNSFFSAEENPFIGFIVRALTGCSDGLEGKRDQGMYGIAYGHGLDEFSDLSPEELKDENRNLSRFDKKEDRYGDDLFQNERQKALYGERIVSKSGEWATKTSKVKPVAYFVSGILGNSWRMGVQTVLDFPAKIWWRIRMFGKSIHGNFVTSIWDLTKFKFLSVFSRDASKKYNDKVQELGKMSNEYFKNKYGDKYTEQIDPGLGTYLKVPFDRLKEHWKNIWDPKAALEQKCKDGFLKSITEEERLADPSKTFSNGCVVLDSKDDQREQKRLAATDFTGPICATLGLIGTVIFDPLKVIWNTAGFESGKNLICALSASRKSFSLINYIFRFIIPEMNAGKECKKLKSLMEEEGPNKKAVAERYYALKSRYHNAITGMAMAAGNICEPFLHLKRGIIGESRFGNFLIDSVIKFNDTFFLRFFCKRREVQGTLEHLKTITQKALGKQHLSNADYAELKDEKFDELMKSRALELPSSTPEVINSVITWWADKLERVKKACTGEIHYALKKAA